MLHDVERPPRGPQRILWGKSRNASAAESPCGEGQFRLRGRRLASVLRYSLKADEARA
jgi:hypothetical protein